MHWENSPETGDTEPVAAAVMQVRLKYMQVTLQNLADISVIFQNFSEILKKKRVPFLLARRFRRVLAFQGEQ